MTPLTPAALRQALLPDAAEDSAAVLAVVSARIAATPQRGGLTARLRPIELAAPASWVAALRPALVAALLLLLAAVALAGSRPWIRGPLDGRLGILRETGSLVAVDPATGDETPVAAFGSDVVVAFRVGPDGSVAALLDPPGLVVADRLGGRARLVAPEGGVFLPEDLAWSPDGARLVAGVSVSGLHRLAVFDVRTGLGALVGPADLVADRASWSPDGRSLAFRAIRPGSVAASVALLDLGTGGVRIVASPGSLYVAEWTPIAWAGPTALVYETSESSSALGAVWVLDLGDGRPRRLTPDDLSGIAPVVSPDGSTVLFARYREALGVEHCAFDLMAVPLDGSAGPAVLLEDAWPAGWGPGGDILAEAQSALPGAPDGGAVLLSMADRRVSMLAPFRPGDAPLDRCGTASGRIELLPVDRTVHPAWGGTP